MTSAAGNAPFPTPMPLDPHRLLAAAERSIDNPPAGQAVDRETIHRAVSTAYYSVFHAINASNADALSALPSNWQNPDAWTGIYREMRHGRAAGYLQRNLRHLSGQGHRVTQNFSQLKTAREAADYDPNTMLELQGARQWILRARAALVALNTLSSAERVTLANITLYGHP